MESASSLRMLWENKTFSINEPFPPSRLSRCSVGQKHLLSICGNRLATPAIYHNVEGHMTLHFINNQHSICPMMAFTLSRCKWMFSIDGKNSTEHNTKGRITSARTNHCLSCKLFR